MRKYVTLMSTKDDGSSMAADSRFPSRAQKTRSFFSDFCGVVSLVFLLSWNCGLPAEQSFIRGDCDSDGRVAGQVTDAVFLLTYNFIGGTEPSCLAACDADGDGRVRGQLTDAIYLLTFNFLGGPAPEAPFPDCGTDPEGSLSCTGLTPCGDPATAIIINEIHYNDASDRRYEFIELFNRSESIVELSGFRFDDGITFGFPSDAEIAGNSYVLVVKDPSHWRSLRVPVFGPFAGSISNAGERLSLLSPSGQRESVRYQDAAPWPLGADGYGPSLERVDPSSPADDFHSWRASATVRGTPGRANSTHGVPTHPLIVSTGRTPSQPTSTDTVDVEAILDVDPRSVRRVRLRSQAVRSITLPVVVSDAVVSDADGEVRFRGRIPPQPSQSLVRYNFEVELEDGRTVVLPPSTDPQPFLSYFAYDGEVRATLPVLWLFSNPPTELTVLPRSYSAAVVLEPGSENTLVFDGVDRRPSRNGQKLRFLKGQEYRGDRTLNIIPERASATEREPHVEHLGFELFRESDALAPRVDWFRVIDVSRSLHTQNLVIQQVNEAFAQLNGLDSDSQIYKGELTFDFEEGLSTAYVNQNDPAAGIDDLLAILDRLNSDDSDLVRRTVMEHLAVENARLYSAVSAFIANWEGFDHNFFVVLDPSSQELRVVPWDLDSTFEEICVDFPLDWPLTGRGVCSGVELSERLPGPISRPFHLQDDLDRQYHEYLWRAIQPGGAFSTGVLTPRTREIEELLLADLKLQEEYLGFERPRRRDQITESYSAIRSFIEQRVALLREALE